MKPRDSRKRAVAGKIRSGRQISARDYHSLPHPGWIILDALSHLSPHTREMPCFRPPKRFHRRYLESYAVRRTANLFIIGAGPADIGLSCESLTSNFSIFRCSCGRGRLVRVMFLLSVKIRAIRQPQTRPNFAQSFPKVNPQLRRVPIALLLCVEI